MQTDRNGVRNLKKLVSLQRPSQNVQINGEKTHQSKEFSTKHTSSLEKSLKMIN